MISKVDGKELIKEGTEGHNKSGRRREKLCGSMEEDAGKKLRCWLVRGESVQREGRGTGGLIDQKKGGENPCAKHETFHLISFYNFLDKAPPSLYKKL
jgi:hypothetical protein